MVKKSHATLQDRIGEMMRVHPFQAFEIRMADGSTIRVVHPDFIMRSPRGETVVVFDPDNHMYIVNVNLIWTLEPVRERSRKPGKR